VRSRSMAQPVRGGLFKHVRLGREALSPRNLSRLAAPAKIPLTMV
jgi:hypothetical protein